MLLGMESIRLKPSLLYKCEVRCFKQSNEHFSSSSTAVLTTQAPTILRRCAGLIGPELSLCIVRTLSRSMSSMVSLYCMYKGYRVVICTIK